MQIKPIASNMTELTFTPKETTAYGDFSVLYSYETPVAGYSDEGTSSNPADEVTAGAPPSGPAPATVTCPGKSKACDCVQAPGSDCGQEFCECSEARGAGCCNDAR